MKNEWKDSIMIKMRVKEICEIVEEIQINLNDSDLDSEFNDCLLDNINPPNLDSKNNKKTETNLNVVITKNGCISNEPSPLLKLLENRKENNFFISKVDYTSPSKLQTKNINDFTETIQMPEVTRYESKEDVEDKHNQSNEMFQENNEKGKDFNSKVKSEKYQSTKLTNPCETPLISSVSSKKHAKSLVVQVMNNRNMQSYMLSNEKIQRIEQFLIRKIEKYIDECQGKEIDREETDKIVMKKINSKLDKIIQDLKCEN